MTETFPTPLIVSYVLYTLFVSYQNLHARRFQGASAFFRNLLILSVMLAWLTGLVFFVTYGLAVHWWAPLALLLGGIAIYIFSSPLDKILGLAFSLLGFLGWPVCAYFMFRAIP